MTPLQKIFTNLAQQRMAENMLAAMNREPPRPGTYAYFKLADGDFVLVGIGTTPDSKLSPPGRKIMEKLITHGHVKLSRRPETINMGLQKGRRLTLA